MYVFDQSQFPPLDETQLKEMDRKITDLNETIKQKEKICGETEARLRSLNSSLTTEEAVKKLQDVRKKKTLLCHRCVFSKIIFVWNRYLLFPALFLLVLLLLLPVALLL